jgi:hypothetical protein
MTPRVRPYSPCYRLVAMSLVVSPSRNSLSFVSPLFPSRPRSTAAGSARLGIVWRLPYVTRPRGTPVPPLGGQMRIPTSIGHVHLVLLDSCINSCLLAD